jgi:peptidoglycan/xylan/chitin deacetylase (PgdA/CDA1 family)
MPSFRLDRFLTLNFFHPLVKKTSLHNDVRIPILMYHSISEDSENSVHPYFRINTSPALFAEHAQYLHDHNYAVINLADLTTFFSAKNKVPSRCVVLTFDDGYRDFHTRAFPVLNTYNFTATVFLPTGAIENRNQKLRGKEHLTWKEVNELSKHEIIFGSHTVTHPQLSTMSREATEYEISKSKETIEDKVGKKADSFSYPFKFPEELKDFTRYLRELLKKYGYVNGVSTRIGTAVTGDDTYFLKRIPVNSYDDLSFFRAKLDGGYDWLHRLQYFKKLTRRQTHYV